jgi:bifunctional non-homologous end joining protein LigD
MGAMPTLVKPMLATLWKPPHGAGWGWEWKWDGARTVAYLDGRGGLRLRSRNDHDVTGSYPEQATLAGVEQPMVLDGEIVALDPSGAPSFGRLQQRMLLCTFPIFDVAWRWSLPGRDCPAGSRQDSRRFR